MKIKSGFAMKPMGLKTPHITLGISLEVGVDILRLISSDIEKSTEEKEDFYKISVENFECGFYSKDGIIHSSWYNDASGRDSEAGINEKVKLYLARYGNIDDWKLGIDNGWIQFFTNENANIGMAYGLHKDVLRFNQFE